MNKKDQKFIKRIRTNILKLTFSAKSSHIGSSLSIVEILYTLYFNILKKNDRFILSKGHAALALYCILYEKGFITYNVLNTYGQDGTRLMAHVSHKVKGVEFSTGSLGHGLSIGVGMAISAKILNKKHKVYVILGDGEINEGSVWEAAMSANKHKIDNLVVLIDYNKMQAYGNSSEVLELEPLYNKWSSFGFEVKEVDGHDKSMLKNVLINIPFKQDKPNLIICHTVKGKGIVFAENNPEWHHKSKINELDLAALKKSISP